MSVFGVYGVPIRLVDEQNFLKVRETLTRIGIASYDQSKSIKSLIQTCHILHKRSEYAIIHFKELFKLDGKDSFKTMVDGQEVIRETIITHEDFARRNTIALLLQDWKLVEIIEPNLIEENVCSMNKIKIVSHLEKNDWNLVSKHSLGRQKRI